jgi:chromosome segregation ATPase
LAEIDTLKAEVSNRESEVAELSNKVSVAEAALQEAATATAELRNNLATAEAKISELAAIAARVPELEEDAKVTAEKIGNEASQLAAAIGLSEPLPDANTGEAKSILAQFNELEGDDATRFYKAHRKQIIAAQLNS